MCEDFRLGVESQACAKFVCGLYFLLFTILEQNAAKDEIRPWPVEWKTRNKMSILPLSFHQLWATSDMARDPWGKCPGLESSEESIPAKLDCENSSY